MPLITTGGIPCFLGCSICSIKGKAVIPVIRSRNMNIDTNIICIFLPMGYTSSYSIGSLICLPDATGTLVSMGMGESIEVR